MVHSYFESHTLNNYCTSVLEKVDIFFEGIDHAMPGEEGVSQPKYLKKFMKLNLEFTEGGVVGSS